MNTPNNKRRRASQEKIERVFVELLQKHDITDISVTDICKSVHLNRSTFYANYTDVYDLADKIRKKLESDLLDLYQDEIRERRSSNDFLPLFKHIKINQLFYKTYFKLGYDDRYKIIGYDTDLARKYFGGRFIDYHIEFFRSGLTAIIKKWLKNNCEESPEEINQILRNEYTHR
jgi:AcrR family transcriptional regulator